MGLVSKDYNYTQSEMSSFSDVHSDLQITTPTPMDRIDVLPTNLFGNIKMDDSSGNHIGTKIVATNFTVVNKNNNSGKQVNPNNNNNQQYNEVTKTSHCTKIILIILIVISFYPCTKLFLFLFFLGNDFFATNMITGQTSVTLSDVTNLQIFKMEIPPYKLKLPDPWIISSQWGEEQSHTIYKPVDKVEYISIGDTKTNTCENMTTCSEIIRQIQLETMSESCESKCNTGYNFFIGYDSRIYKGLAWVVTQLGPDTIKIAFIGDYSRHGRNDISTVKQIYSLSKFIEISEYENRLNTNYSIIPECCIHNCKSPGENIYKSMELWGSPKSNQKCVVTDEYKQCGYLTSHYFPD